MRAAGLDAHRAGHNDNAQQRFHRRRSPGLPIRNGLLSCSLAPSFIGQRDAVIEIRVVFVERVDDQSVALTDLPQTGHHWIVFSGQSDYRSETVFIDRNGVVQEVFLGILSQAVLEERINKLLTD